MNAALYVDLMLCFLDPTFADTNMNCKRSTFILYSTFPSHLHKLMVAGLACKSAHQEQRGFQHLTQSILTCTCLPEESGIEPPTLQLVDNLLYFL